MFYNIYNFVYSQSENCRVAMCENQQWSVLMLMFGLVTCSVPPQMKSEILHTLAALAQTPEIAATLWQTLEAAQVGTCCHVDVLCRPVYGYVFAVFSTD